MPDKEQVIRAIEIHLDLNSDCEGCAYDNGEECFKKMITDAVALLREQEAVEPITAREGRNKYWSYYVCPNCNDDLFYGQKYCSECGKAVKWDA